jgi:HEPN domain-containing protein
MSKVGSCMKPRTQEWVDKAEGDFITAGRELEAPQAPYYDSVCFHAQQCVEKYFKARLYEADIPFSKIHDLRILLKSYCRSNQLGNSGKKP